MAEFISRQATALASTPPVKASPTDHGHVMVMSSRTPSTAAWAQNDTFVVGTLPKGSRVLSMGVVKHGAFGASVTMDIGARGTDGTVIDADGFAAALNVAAAGTKAIQGGALLQPAGYVCTADTVVYATLAGANPTDDAQAEFELAYIGPTA